jgi:hypothetical protein
LRNIARLDRDFDRASDGCPIHPGTRAVFPIEDPVAHCGTGDIDNSGGVDAEIREVPQVRRREVLAASGHEAHWHRPKTSPQCGKDGPTTKASEAGASVWEYDVVDREVSHNDHPSAVGISFHAATLLGLCF